MGLRAATGVLLFGPPGAQAVGIEAGGLPAADVLRSGVAVCPRCLGFALQCNGSTGECRAPSLSRLRQDAGGQGRCSGERRQLHLHQGTRAAQQVRCWCWDGGAGAGTLLNGGARQNRANHNRARSGLPCRPLQLTTPVTVALPAIPVWPLCSPQPVSCPIPASSLQVCGRERAGGAPAVLARPRRRALRALL